MSVDLRPAQPTDAGAVGEILYQFQTRVDWMPDLYTHAEYIGFAGAMIDRGWVTVADIEGQVEGFCARDGEELCALYTTRRGSQHKAGLMLLDAAKAASDRLSLRAIEANLRALKFYRRAGFVAQGRSDGAGTDEGLPDVTLVWEKEKKDVKSASTPKAEPAGAGPVRNRRGQPVPERGPGTSGS